MEHSETLTDLAAALSKAQSEVEGAVKGKVNPAFRSRYADLASVWEACREALTTNGLSVIQSPGEMIEGKSMAMTTMLLHSSGQWVRDRLTIPVGKLDAHGYGSATTYARRFALAAFVGVAPEDDDGNAAAKPKPPASNADEPEQPPQGRRDTGPGLPDSPDWYGCKGERVTSASQAKKDGLDVWFEEARTQIAALTSANEWREWCRQNSADVAKLPKDWRAILRAEADEMATELGVDFNAKRAA